MVREGQYGLAAARASLPALTLADGPSHADADTPLLELSLRARDRHLALAGELEAETGMSVEISSLGALDVAFTDEDERALGARLAWQRGHGLPVQALTAEEIRQAEPNVNPAVPVTPNRFAMSIFPPS